MKHRAATALLLYIVLAAATALPVAAGGWAVTALDRLPVEVRAGEHYQIGYTILQHGQTPFSSRDTRVRIRTVSGEEHVFQARREGAPGHYVAEITFPAAGTWSWEITHEFGPHTLPPVSVLSAQLPENASEVPVRAPAPEAPLMVTRAAPQAQGSLTPGTPWLTPRLLLPALTLVVLAAFGMQLLAFVRRSPLMSARESAMTRR